MLAESNYVFANRRCMSDSRLVSSRPINLVKIRQRVRIQTELLPEDSQNNTNDSMRRRHEFLKLIAPPLHRLGMLQRIVLVRSNPEDIIFRHVIKSTHLSEQLPRLRLISREMHTRFCQASILINILAPAHLIPEVPARLTHLVLHLLV